MTDHTRRTVLRGIAGASAVAAAGVPTAGTSLAAAQAADWSSPPGIERAFDFDVPGNPFGIGYTNPEEASDTAFEVSGTIDTDGGNTGAWLAEYDDEGNELFSTTVYDASAGYPTWGFPLGRTTGGGFGTIVRGFTEDGAGDRQAVYAAGLPRDRRSVNWTTTLADDVEYTDDRSRFPQFSTFSDFARDPPTLKVASGGASDPVVVDDWVNVQNGATTRNLAVSDSNVADVGFVTYGDGERVIFGGTATGGGAFVRAATGDDPQVWRTDLSEFSRERVVAGDFTRTADPPEGFALVADDASAGEYLKRFGKDGTVTASKTYTPPDGGDSVTELAFTSYFLPGFSMIGPTDGGSWVRYVSEDLSVKFEATVDGEARNLSPIGLGFLGGEIEGYSVVGRRNGAPTFWRFDAEGNLRWDVTLGNDETDRIRATNVGIENGDLLAGSTGSMGEGEGNPWLVRLNDDGTVAWEEVYGGGEWGGFARETEVNDLGGDSLPDGVVFTESGRDVSTVDVLELSTDVDREGGGDGGLARFDRDGDGRIGLNEVLNAITAFNTGGTVGGEPVSLDDVLSVITAFNTGQSV